MASSHTLSSCALMASKQSFAQPHSPSLHFISHFKSSNPIRIPQPMRRRLDFQRAAASAVRAEFDISFFERDLDRGDAPPEVPGSGFPDMDGVEEPECPPGLRKYETMVVLRPDMSEDERLTFTQKYEELLVAGGGMYVEVFNRGVIPLAYSIRKKNKAGEANTYMDSIFLLFTFFTKPESLSILSEVLLADDDVLRSSTIKIRKRKY